MVDIFYSLEVAPDWRQKMAELVVKNSGVPSLAVLRDKRRRLSRAYADGAYSEDEYNRRLTEIDFQMRQANGAAKPEFEEALALFADIPSFWSEATADEKGKLLQSVIETVFIDLREKRVLAVRPTPALKALYGKAIGLTRGAKMRLIRVQKRGNVGVGGDGGESNSPSNENLPGYTTG